MGLDTQAIFVHIVDDDESVRKGLSRLMRSAAIESKSYASAECFLEQFRADGLACILMDINMPGMNGLELAEQLQARGIRLPVIAISARDDDETRKLIRELGVKFFLRKPVDDQALIDTINWVTRNEHSLPQR